MKNFSPFETYREIPESKPLAVWIPILPGGMTAVEKAPLPESGVPVRRELDVAAGKCGTASFLRKKNALAYPPNPWLKAVKALAWGKCCEGSDEGCVLTEFFALPSKNKPK